MEKVCSICHAGKPLSMYRKKSKKCIPCQDEYLRVYYLQHMAEKKQYDKIYNIKNASKKKTQQREYYLKNKLKILKTNNEWRKKNPERMRQLTEKWVALNPDRRRMHSRQGMRRLLNTKRGKIQSYFGHQIYLSLKANKAGRKWESFVDYTLPALMRHLEKQFLPGMTWENYGPAWHIDHIIPKSAFHYNSPEDVDFRKCWALKNLRPLWATDNVRKSDKLNRPFQPSLNIHYAELLKATL
jgi:hypothetical protein